MILSHQQWLPRQLPPVVMRKRRTWVVMMKRPLFPAVFSQKSRQSSHRGKFSQKFCPSGRIRHVQNTTSCHNSGTINWNSIRICTVRVHAPHKYPPRNTMPKSPGTNSNPLQISWSGTSFSATGGNGGLFLMTISPCLLTKEPCDHVRTPICIKPWETMYYKVMRWRTAATEAAPDQEPYIPMNNLLSHENVNI